MIVTRKSLVLNGSGYLQASGSGVFANTTTVVVIRFKSNLISSDNVLWTWLDATMTGSTEIAIWKAGAGANANKLYYMAGGIVLAGTGITPAQYAASYKEYDWNVFEVHFISGASKFYINGTQVATTSTTTFTPKNPTTFYIGGANTPVRYAITGQVDYCRIYSDAAKTTLLAAYEFRGNYNSEISATNNGTALGTGNRFASANKDYKFGRQLQLAGAYQSSVYGAGYGGGIS